eukprot:gb/GFBE01076288.1/.p1 GENE.gb/GFBE01076288.1/~~gb/GFBE01076288.1/.p1  ORF type:complete len:329 (+),score=14.11 gb/GFBE01076288.1/:1-987(+)
MHELKKITQLCVCVCVCVCIVCVLFLVSDEFLAADASSAAVGIQVQAEHRDQSPPITSPQIPSLSPASEPSLTCFWHKNTTVNPVSLCGRLADFIRRRRLEHVYVFAPAKCAGTTIRYYINPNETMNSRVPGHICKWAVSGGHVWPTRGMGELALESCARRALFLVTVREQQSWLMSAVWHVCWKMRHGKPPHVRNCTDATWIEKRPHELGISPDTVMHEEVLLDSGLNVLLVDYRDTDHVLKCLPRKGHKGKVTSTELASLVWARQQTAPSANVAQQDSEKTALQLPPLREMQTHYFKRHRSGWWIGKYIAAMTEQSCAIANFSGII